LYPIVDGLVLGKPLRRADPKDFPVELHLDLPNGFPQPLASRLLSTAKQLLTAASWLD
jgi:hypothetical protein